MRSHLLIASALPAAHGFGSLQYLRANGGNWPGPYTTMESEDTRNVDPLQTSLYESGLTFGGELEVKVVDDKIRIRKTPDYSPAPPPKVRPLS